MCIRDRAIKTCSVQYWEHNCKKCDREFHVEAASARLAPDAPLYVAPDEYPFSVLDQKKGVICPFCGNNSIINLGKGKKKKVELTLLVHPQWLAGSAKPVSYTHLRAHETVLDLVCRLLLEKKTTDHL